MKRKDKSRKRDSSASQDPARPRPATSAPREGARRVAPRAQAERTPTHKKRKARRTGRSREPATSRVETRHHVQPPVTQHEAVVDERTAVDEAGLGDTDVASEEAFELGIGARVLPPTTQYG